MAEERLIDLARRMSVILTPGDMDHTLRQITTAAVEVLPEVAYASITILHADGRLETAAPTDEMLLGVDAAQYRLREGPCYQAATSTDQIISPDLSTDERFPQYAVVAVAAGIRAQAGIRLFDAPKSQGALNLYSLEVGAFEDADSLQELFNHQSAQALRYAREISNLKETVKTRGMIGRAVGIVMERYGLTEQRAFAFLTRLSQHGNIKLRTVAQEIADSTEEQATTT